jgi:hypothetical protein
MLTYTDVCKRMPTVQALDVAVATVCRRMPTYADVC